MLDGLRLDVGSVLNALADSGGKLGHEELAIGIFENLGAVLHDAFGDDDVDDLSHVVAAETYWSGGSVRRSIAMGSMRSGLSVHCSVFPGCPFCAPGLRVVFFVLGLAPRGRPGSFDGAIPLLELLTPSFSIISVMMVTQQLHHTAHGRRDRSILAKQLLDTS
jgi:hypothetical protein